MRYSQVLLIDVTRLVARFLEGRLPTGVDRVSLEYIRHFYDNAQAMVRYHGRWLELSVVDSRRLFDALLVYKRKLKWLIYRLITKAWWSNFLPSNRTTRLLLEIGHHGMEQVDYFEKLSKYKLQPIFFVHDLIPVFHPEYCRSGEAEKHNARMNTALKLGQGIIVNSDSTLAELNVYAKSIGQPLPLTIAAKLSAAKLPEPDPIPIIDSPYFVILGTIEPRKNHLMILQVWRRLVEQLRDAAPKLVIIGQRGWECENVVDMLERCELLHDFVLERPNCSDTELATYLRHTKSLLFPSFAEGYGLPLVESLTLGTPVIASNLQVFHEIAGDVPDYLDPLDGVGWLDKIKEFSLPNSQPRAEQLKRMKSFEAPSWSTHFNLVDQFICDIADRQKNNGK